MRRFSAALQANHARDDASYPCCVASQRAASSQPCPLRGPHARLRSAPFATSPADRRHLTAAGFKGQSEALQKGGNLDLPSPQTRKPAARSDRESSSAVSSTDALQAKRRFEVSMQAFCSDLRFAPLTCTNLHAVVVSRTRKGGQPTAGEIRSGLPAKRAGSTHVTSAHRSRGTASRLPHFPSNRLASIRVRCWYYLGSLISP